MGLWARIKDLWKEEVPGPEWQPMETVPETARDGERVDLWMVHYNNDPPFVLHDAWHNGKSWRSPVRYRHGYKPIRWKPGMKYSQ